MAKNWGDYFAEAYTTSYGKAQEQKFEKWKLENDPYTKAQRNTMLWNEIKARVDMGLDPTPEQMTWIQSQRGQAPGVQPPIGQMPVQPPVQAVQPGVVPPQPGVAAPGIAPSPGINVGGQQFVPTEMRPTPLGGPQVTKYGPSAQSKADLEIETNWKKTVTKNKKTAWENFNQTHALLKNTMAQFKAARVEMKARGVPEGLATKAMGGVAKTLELQGYPQTKAYEGQVIETAMSLSKIITGGARIIRSVINQLIKTLPQATGIQKDADAKIAQSFRNAFTKSHGKPLTKAETAFMDKQVAELLATPAATIPGGVAPVDKTYTFQVGGENYNIPSDKVLEFINSFPKDTEIYDMTK